MCVGARRSHKVIVTDLLADPSPWDTRKVQQRHTAMPEACGEKLGTPAAVQARVIGGAEAVAAEPLEHRAFRDAVVARHKPCHSAEQNFRGVSRQEREVPDDALADAEAIRLAMLEQRHEPPDLIGRVAA
jgi:hypothetical protein